MVEKYVHASDGGLYIGPDSGRLDKIAADGTIVTVPGWSFEANGLTWVKWWCGSGWHENGNDGPDDDCIRVAPPCLQHLARGVKYEIVGARTDAIQLAIEAHRSPAWGRALEALTELWSEQLLICEGLMPTARNLNRIRRKAAETLDEIAADPTRFLPRLIEKTGGDLDEGFTDLIDWRDPIKWLRRRIRRKAA